MNDSELARFFLSLVLVLSAALAGGYLFERFKLPRVIGEITGGILLGPSVLGLISLDVYNWVFAAFPAQGALLAAFYWFGLVLLMFTAGFSMTTEAAGGTSRVVFALVIGALILPFAIGYGSASIFDDTRVGDDLAFKIVMGIAVAVTSIPVISRIFLDLNMMHTLFARNIVGAATIQDLVLWTLLAVATAIQHGNATDAAGITRVVLITLLFVALSFSRARAPSRNSPKCFWQVQRSIVDRLRRAPLPRLCCICQSSERKHRFRRAHCWTGHYAVLLAAACGREAADCRYLDMVLCTNLLRPRRLTTRFGTPARYPAYSALHYRK